MSNPLIRSIKIEGRTFDYVSLREATQKGLMQIERLPRSLRILAENLLRHAETERVKKEDIRALSDWGIQGKMDHEVAYHPGRILMQDYTGVPALADLAAMRDAFKKMLPQADGKAIDACCPVHLVVDHSVQVEYAGDATALSKNTTLEITRNRERYQFLRWGQQAFDALTVIPPGMGICHQVNLESIATVVAEKPPLTDNGNPLLCPDTVIGLDSHTTMVNAMGVLAWGVGGIEAEAVMLGEPIRMIIPEVVGVELRGFLPTGTTATDLVLTIAERLRQKNVVGKFVEFYGPALATLSLAQRATIANMAPEYGATCGFFPVDQQTLDYLTLTNRKPSHVAVVKAYCEAQGLWYDHAEDQTIRFTDKVAIDLTQLKPSLAGPKRPQDRVLLGALPEALKPMLSETATPQTVVSNPTRDLEEGDVVIAAITSCTNTSNPNVMIAAGLLAKNALAKGLKCRPWVKTSLAPGSKVVADYLEATGLQTSLSKLGFDLVGFGCTTCIGNSGPLAKPVSDAIQARDLSVCAVLSGNRNFEGRIHPLVKANWLASPPLVVAFAIAGTMNIDLTRVPLGYDQDEKPVYLSDLWPSDQAIREAMGKITRVMFDKAYKNATKGPEAWQSLPAQEGDVYAWDAASTYIQRPPFMEHLSESPEPVFNIQDARILAVLGDSITTDHISPAGSITARSPAGHYLTERSVQTHDFNSFGTRRGNHEVMMRGTFGNIRLQNEMVPEQQGGVTRHQPTGTVLSIYDAAMRYRKENTPLVLIAGKEYGTGSSRDWAAKGPYLLGVRAVIAESYERIHRSNLIGMGILPLAFASGEDRLTLGLTGDEQVSITGLDKGIRPKMTLQAQFQRASGEMIDVTLRCCIETDQEVDYYRHGGILPYVLRKQLAAHAG